MFEKIKDTIYWFHGNLPQWRSALSLSCSVGILVVVVTLGSSASSLAAVSGNQSETAAHQVFVTGKKTLDEGKVNKAEGSWKPIMGDNLYGPVAYLLLARGFARERNFSKSESLVRDFLKLYPSSPYREASIEELTEYVYQQGKPEASRLLMDALPNASEGRKPTILLQLGDLEARSGALPKAETYYRKLYLTYPASPEGLQAKERISRLVFEKKLQKPRFTESELLSRATRLIAGGRHDLAADVYHNIAVEKPSDSSLMIKYARSLYKDRKNNEAVKVLTELVASPLPEDKRLEALYILSLLYWRMDKDADFEACCSKILDNKAAANYKRRVLANLAAFNYEKGRLSRADSYYKRLLAEAVDPSMKAKIKWRIAWIKYRTRQYNEAADVFRELRQISNDQQIARASKYWEARSTTLAGKFDNAIPLYKSLAENSPFDYYGSQAQKILLSAKQPFAENLHAVRKPFPDLSINSSQKSNKLVANALELVDLGLPEFALLNLEAVPKSLRSAPSILLLMARAAHDAGYYALSHEIVIYGFSEFVDNPPDNAPREFIELAFPRVHFTETAENAARGGVNPYLVWAIVRQESRYDAFAVSPAGALGLMQVTPRTALVITKKNDDSNDAIVQELMDPKKNLSVGIQVLAQNIRQFKGNIVPAVAAYNADINKVRQWIVRNGRMRQDEFIENIPFAETRLYVKKVLANFAAYSKLYARKDLAGSR